MRLTQDAAPAGEHRQANEAINTRELETYPAPHPPIPIRTSEHLMSLVVSKASNETEITVLEDGDSQSLSDVGSVFEEEVVDRSSCDLSCRSVSRTPELPQRTSDMYITADGLSCRSCSIPPDLPPRTADTLSCQSWSIPPDLPPRAEAISCHSDSHDVGPTNSTENLLQAQAASIQSLLSEDYDRLETFLGTKSNEKNDPLTVTDISSTVNNSCKAVDKADNLDDKSTDKESDAASQLANGESTSPSSDTKEPLLSVQDDDSLLPPPIPSKISRSTVGMERPNTGKREPRPPPPITRARSDAPPPPLPPKGVPNTEKPNFALPPRNIKRNVHSVDGSVPQVECDDKMKLMFNESYHTFVEHFYKTN